MPRNQIQLSFDPEPEELQQFFATVHSGELEWIGNPATRPIFDAACRAWGRDTHQVDKSFALFGPATPCEGLARTLAGSVKLPLVVVRGLAIERPLDLLVNVSLVCEETKIETPQGEMSLELVPEEAPNWFNLPSIIVFIHELADVPIDVLRRIAKAIDTRLPVYDADHYTVDCELVCWLLGSENRELLEKLGLPVIDLTAPYDRWAIKEDVPATGEMPRD